MPAARTACSPASSAVHHDTTSWSILGVIFGRLTRRGAARIRANPDRPAVKC